MLLVVNVLTNSPKIVDLIPRHYLQLNLSYINGKLG